MFKLCQIQNYNNHFINLLTSKINQFLQVKSKRNFFQFGFQLCRRNPSCLKKNNHFLEIVSYIQKFFKINKNQIIKLVELNREPFTIAYNQLILSNQQINKLLNRLCSMLKQFISQNEDNRTAIQGINEQFDIIKKKDYLNMDNFKFSDRDQINQVEMITEYHNIYPIIFHPNQRSNFNQISSLSLFQRMKEINDDFLSYKIPQQFKSTF
ncbi:unnamed protein product [Paramecium sonneborni]|uniref:Uncharacterized protein n=1 Tax=Paramecium sonneborni TaxID=65129 RepID=A0A8S1LTN6_9CILI|nr:unnamed protein product [Paramecium sonneborni]